MGRAEGIPELFVAELHELRLIGAVIITFQDEKTWGPAPTMPLCASQRRTAGAVGARDADDVLYLEWKATGGGRKIEDGIDTFIFQDGMIRVQTVVYTVQLA